MELQDRLNWQQACTVLGCSKTTLYKLVKEKHLRSYGTGTRYRWFSRDECVDYVEKADRKKLLPVTTEEAIEKGSLGSCANTNQGQYGA